MDRFVPIGAYHDIICLNTSVNGNGVLLGKIQQLAIRTSEQ